MTKQQVLKRRSSVENKSLFCDTLYSVTMSSFASGSSFSKTKYRYEEPDNMQYNRARLMRMQEEGVEIVINPKPKPIARRPNPVNPPTVTIKNLNVIADQKQIPDEDDENKKDSKPETKDDKDAEQKKYSPKPDLKKIMIRKDYHWFIMKFENAMEFYQFLDKFQIFGLLAEEDGCLIITNYDDLLGENKKYRMVKFTQFDKWTAEHIEEKNSSFKKFFNNSNSIKKKGVVLYKYIHSKYSLFYKFCV